MSTIAVGDSGRRSRPMYGSARCATTKDAKTAFLDVNGRGGGLGSVTPSDVGS
jgi:hypothetical protein